MDNGYIKLYRKICDSACFADGDALRVWIYLLTHANFTEKQVFIGNNMITVRPGQLVTGRLKLAQALKLNEFKVERKLKLIEIAQQIEQQTFSKYRIITICNWESYQVREQQNAQQKHNKRTTDAQQMHTTKNVKKVKNEKNIYMDCVSLYQEEYEKLVKSHGEFLITKAIEILNNYKMASGKKYKSDYHAMLNWVIDKAKGGQDGQGVGRGVPRNYREVEEPSLITAEDRERRRMATERALALSRDRRANKPPDSTDKQNP